jgi:hypothetical protein
MQRKNRAGHKPQICFSTLTLCVATSQATSCKLQVASCNWQLANAKMEHEAQLKPKVKLETGNWKLETGNWKLETGNLKLETENWKLETGNWQQTTGQQTTTSWAIWPFFMTLPSHEVPFSLHSAPLRLVLQWGHLQMIVARLLPLVPPLALVQTGVVYYYFSLGHLCLQDHQHPRACSHKCSHW